MLKSKIQVLSACPYIRKSDFVVPSFETGEVHQYFNNRFDPGGSGNISVHLTGHILEALLPQGN